MDLNVELCGSENRFLDSVRAVITAAESEVYVITGDRSWAFPLMITLIAALNRRVRISVIYFPPTEADAKSHRVDLLRNIGCSVTVTEVGKLSPFNGVVTDPLSENPREVVRTPEFNYLGIVAHTRWGPTYRDHIQRRFHSVRDGFAPGHNPFIPQLTTVSIDELLRVLRQKSRFYENCSVTLEDVVVRQTRPQHVLVKAYKAHQVSTLDEMLLRHQFDLYGAVVATLRNGHYTPILPPVVELHEAYGTVIIEGHTRFFRAIQQGRRTVRALVFRGVAFEPPSCPRSWTDVRLCHDDPQDLINHNRDLARYIERDGRDAAEWM